MYEAVPSQIQPTPTICSTEESVQEPKEYRYGTPTYARPTVMVHSCQELALLLTCVLCAPYVAGFHSVCAVVQKTLLLPTHILHKVNARTRSSSI